MRALALARGSGEDRFEEFGESLQARMREGFLALAREFPGRFRVIDGNREMDAVAADIAATADAFLTGR